MALLPVGFRGVKKLHACRQHCAPSLFPSERRRSSALYVALISRLATAICSGDGSLFLGVDRSVQSTNAEFRIDVFPAFLTPVERMERTERGFRLSLNSLREKDFIPKVRSNRSVRSIDRSLKLSEPFFNVFRMLCLPKHQTAIPSPVRRILFESIVFQPCTHYSL